MSKNILLPFTQTFYSSLINIIIAAFDFSDTFVIASKLNIVAKAATTKSFIQLNTYNTFIIQLMIGFFESLINTEAWPATKSSFWVTTSRRLLIVTEATELLSVFVFRIYLRLFRP